MKANYINNYGGPEELVYGDLQDPVPSKGEVLIQIKASSINPLDFKIRHCLQINKLFFFFFFLLFTLEINIQFNSINYHYYLI